jgi:DNA-directed RNA polymerase specialized sigma24 family protein
MGYVAEHKSQINSELALLMPRLKAFAAALTGSQAQSQTLLKATHSYTRSKARERGHTPMALWAFTHMHNLWANRMKPARGERGSQADARLFCPRSRAGDGMSGAVRFARMLAQLPPEQRGALHLTYGERLSYDEVAEVFSVPVATIITWLAKAYAVLSEVEGRETQDFASQAMAARARPGGAGHQRQGWAA